MLKRVAEGLPLTGRIRVRVFEHEAPGAPGLLVATYDFANLITAAGKDGARQAIYSTGIDMGIRYLAWGDDVTAPALADVTLGNELGRKATTSQSLSGVTGRVDTTIFLGPTDANESIEELGWFASTTATASADSGILYARVLFSEVKTTAKTIQVDREDTFG